MDDKPILPHRLILLGEALRPIWRKIQDRLDEPVDAATPVLDLTGVISFHMKKLEGLIQNLGDEVNHPMSDVVDNEHATDRDVYRAVGRFEASVDYMLTSYRDARALDACDEDAEACDLLAGVYRRLLIQIRDWLGDLVEFLADPTAVLRRRGLPTTGHVEFDLSLILKPPPELDSLMRWMKDNYGAFTSCDAARTKSVLGFWGTVAAAVAGWELGNMLFRKN
jgi:hypothetical protein